MRFDGRPKRPRLHLVESRERGKPSAHGFLRVVDGGDNEQEESQAGRYRKQGVSLVGQRVLIVSSNEETRAQLARTLMKAGFEVAGEAADGHSALDVVYHDTPDLLITDRSLPEMDGIDLVRRVRLHAALPIIVLARLTENVSKDEVFEAGASGLLTLPLHRDGLLPALVSAILRFRAAEQIEVESSDEAEQREARQLLERAVAIMVKRWNVGESEAFRQISLRSHHRRQPLRQTAMEIIGADLLVR